jgi:hypothetical protein
LVGSLKKWRRQREISYDLIDQMHRDLEEEVFDYRASENDPDKPKISNKPIFEAWQSFSIVVEEIHHFEFGSEEDWLIEFNKLSEQCYEQFELTRRRMENGEILKDKTILLFHSWENSTARDKLCDEVKYRG